MSMCISHTSRTRSPNSLTCRAPSTPRRLHAYTTETQEAEEVTLRGGLRMLASVYDALFPYQRTGVRWMWELHQQRAGGIVGDEMGLGKTVQVAALLGALHYSGALRRPSIVVAPATVLRQWVRELHTWAPPLRVLLMHDSGGAMRRGYSRSQLIANLFRRGGVLLTT